MTSPLDRRRRSDDDAPDERRRNVGRKGRRRIGPFQVVRDFFILAALVLGLITAGQSRDLARNAREKSSTAAKKSDTAQDKSTTAVEKASKTDNRLEALEAANERSNRATAFRLCTRNKVDRAFAHSRIAVQARRGPPAQRVAARRLLADLERADGLPVLDCRPNAKGLGAKVLPPAAQERFVRRWEQHRLSPTELGVCPRSRIGSLPSVLRCD